MHYFLDISGHANQKHTFSGFEKVFLNIESILVYYIQDLQSNYFWDNNPVIVLHTETLSRVQKLFKPSGEQCMNLGRPN